MNPTSGTHTIRVVLADDHELVREGLRSVLGRQTDIRVVGEADGGQAALMLARRLRPDVLVLDLAMPDLDGVAVTQRLCGPTVAGGKSGPRVLALSIHDDRRYVQRMLDAGARGYLTKDCALDELADAIRAVAQGRIYLSSRVVAAGPRGGEADAGDADGQLPLPTVLTAREREILIAVARGQTSREMAAALGLSTRTIETHRRNIGDKLGLQGVAELTRYALRTGLVAPE